MPCYAGLDASKKFTSICVLSASGAVISEGKVASTPRDITKFLRGDGRRYRLVGLEAGSMAQWLYQGLARTGLPVVCVETHHAHVTMKAQPNKTDRADAHGIANLVRTGAFRAVHIKTPESQRIRAVLTTRRLLKSKMQDVQNGIRGLLLEFGLKLDAGRKNTFEPRAKALLGIDPFVTSLIAPLLKVRTVLKDEIDAIDKQLLALAEADPVCRLLMTTPGVGAVVALHFRTSIDIPHRFRRSRDVGPYFGLVPKTFQSGESERRGHVSKRGDKEVRAALYLGATAVLRDCTRSSWLKAWGLRLAERRGKKSATVAVARRLAVVMHRMWLNDTPFRCDVAG